MHKIKHLKFQWKPIFSIVIDALLIYQKQNQEHYYNFIVVMNTNNIPRYLWQLHCDTKIFEISNGDEMTVNIYAKRECYV